MKQLLTFASRFDAALPFNPEQVTKKDDRYYLISPELTKIAKGDYFYAGLYLGKDKNGMFFPSFNLLNLLSKSAKNKVVLDRKAAWLFICGRDVFRKGVVRVFGSKRRGDASLVFNEFGDCLGFGKILGGLSVEAGGKEAVAVENVLDLGDFLRREDKR
jgi:ribosome biogenesis protein Nip4